MLQITIFLLATASWIHLVRGRVEVGDYMKTDLDEKTFRLFCNSIHRSPGCSLACKIFPQFCQTEPTTTHTPTTTGSATTPLPSTTLAPLPCGSPPFSCAGKETGLYQDPWDCNTCFFCYPMGPGGPQSCEGNESNPSLIRPTCICETGNKGRTETGFARACVNHCSGLIVVTTPAPTTTTPPQTTTPLPQSTTTPPQTTTTPPQTTTIPPQSTTTPPQSTTTPPQTTTTPPQTTTTLPQTTTTPPPTTTGPTTTSLPTTTLPPVPCSSPPFNCIGVDNGLYRDPWDCNTCRVCYNNGSSGPSSCEGLENIRPSTCICETRNEGRNKTGFERACVNHCS